MALTRNQACHVLEDYHLSLTHELIKILKLWMGKKTWISFLARTFPNQLTAMGASSPL
jgi:hypothetical protein